MNSFKYPRDMIEPLKAEWDDWFREPGEPPPLPNDEKLAQLLEVAYHASFTADERRGTQFRAVVCGQDAPDVGYPFPIQPPRPFAPHEIMRLAPAAGQRMLAVDASGKTPVIWGFCDGTDMQLTIAVLAPGTLHVGRPHRNIVTLEDGRLFGRWERMGLFQPISELLDNATQALWEGIEWPGGSWSPQRFYPEYLYDALMEVRRLGHGGTILVIPDSEWQSPAWREIVRIKYQCHEASIWPLLRKDACRYDQSDRQHGIEQNQFDAAEAEAKRLLARLPALTAVDGALLITDHYRVLGFGVEVRTNTEVDEIYLPDGTSRNVEAYGTRHRSAFRFSAAYPRGAALVCSQDGAIKCVRNQEGRVTLYE